MKINIQVNRLRYSITENQFKTIAQILRLDELGILAEPALTFSVYNYGLKFLQKEQKQIKKAEVQVKEIVMDNKRLFNIFWALYPPPGRKDYESAFDIFVMLDNVPRPEEFHCLVLWNKRQWREQGFFPAIGDYLKTKPWENPPKVVITELERRRDFYKETAERTVHKFFQDNAI